MEGQHYQIQGKSCRHLTPKLYSESIQWLLGKLVGIGKMLD
jgi:hypothetical protein